MATKGIRGFGSMDRDRQRQIASKGGKSAHLKKTAHEFTADEARAAGRKGGESVSRDRAHMAAIGRQGGLAKRIKHPGGVPSIDHGAFIPAGQRAGDGNAYAQVDHAATIAAALLPSNVA